MKKRLMSIVLTLVMLLSLLPAAAFAAEDGVLRMHIRTDNGETAVTKWETKLYNSWEARFYLHHSDGSTELVDPEELTMSGILRLESVGSDGWCTLGTVGVGRGRISYDGHDLPVESALPDLGLYSGLSADGTAVDTATIMREVTISKDSKVFYIALSPELVTEGRRMTAVNTTFGGEIGVPSVTEIANVALSADGTYATVTVTNLTAEGPYHFQASMNGDGNWGRSIWINNAMPKLYYVDLKRDNDAWTVKLDHLDSSMWCTPGNSRVVNFYFGSLSEIQSGKVEPLTLEDLTFPSYMEAEDFEDEDRTVPPNTYEVRTVGFDNGNESTDIVYELNGTEYKLSAVPQLPELGAYTGSTASKAKYIHREEPFVVTAAKRTFYICPVDTDEIKVLSVEGWQDDVPADMFTVTPSVDANGEADGQYLKVTVNSGMVVEDRFYEAEVNFRYYDKKDGWVDETDRVSIRLENGQPTLLWRHMDWDDAEQEWVESDRETENRLQLNAGDDMPVQFYYGLGKNLEKVELSDLTFPGIVKAYKQDGVLRIKATAFEGSGVISYTDPVSGVTATMQVSVEQPDFGFYSSKNASASTYLGDEVKVSNANTTFYVVADDRNTIGEVAAIRNNRTGENAVDCFDVQISADGKYAAFKMKKDADGNLPAGGDYQLQLRQDWGIRYLRFDLIRMDLQQLSTPADLSWHRDYSWDWENEKLVYSERKGSMSFCVGELTQNHYRTEIYSAADNYSEPVLESGWGFGDMDHSQYFSVTDFIYSELGSGTYKFRVLAEGDGTKYRDSEWSALSEAWTYTAPAAQLTEPDKEDLSWKRNDGRFMATWPNEEQTGAGYYEVNWYYEDPDSGKKERSGGTFDIPVEDIRYGNSFMEPIHDEIVEEHGNVPYFFRVRVIPADITAYRISPWSEYGPALDTTKVTEMVNDKLDDLLPNSSSGQKPTVDEVQKALVNNGEDLTADLRQAMTADLSISGGANSGTLDLIKELEAAVSDNVEQKVEVKNNSVPQNIKDIAGDIEMVGATLNLADKNPGNGKDPTVTLEIDEPKEGIVIPEQQHNAVQFSMKLNGAVDKNDQEQAGQLLIVPVVIDMPVPAGINPDFLVVLHKLWDGSIEQMRPHVYWAEAENRYRATFVVDSFSDFALLEYDFAFESDSVSKNVGDAPFVLAATGNAAGSEVTYSSSDESVAAVDPVTGEVTVLKAGTVTITATAEAVGIYPEAETSYTLTVKAKSAPSAPPAKPSSKPEAKNPFTDVAEGKYYYDAVLWAVENGITTGTGDGTTFSPNATCTRAQVVTFLWRAAGCPAPKSMVSAFTDLDENAYYYSAVLWAIENGITTGTGDGTTFSPNETVTRGQVVTFQYRFAGSPAVSADADFTDVAESKYYADAVAWAVENGITNGKTATTFEPGTGCTRGNIVTFLYRDLAE